ncbi:MAG TPA: DUF2141 domain-containing protein [Kofleriaceae bacterium]|nr:DUF2141 domain-containing protein [Kofleriaceae bacterium]
MTARTAAATRTRAASWAAWLGPALLVTMLGAGERAAAGPEAEPDASSAARARHCTIAVEMSGFHSDKGQALIAVFSSPRGFPDRTKLALRRVPVAIRERKARAVLRALPAGTYAIGVLHDEDGDHRMKTGLFGRPLEGYGASRDARGRMGPPRFDDARLTLRPGQTLVAPIHMTYP